MTHPIHAPEAVARAAFFDLPAGSWPAVSRDAAEGEADVVTVYHDPDGGWWFGSASEAEVVPQCLACVLTRHPEVSELADLPSIGQLSYAKGCGSVDRDHLNGALGMTATRRGPEGRRLPRRGRRCAFQPDLRPRERNGAAHVLDPSHVFSPISERPRDDQGEVRS